MSKINNVHKTGIFIGILLVTAMYIYAAAVNVYAESITSFVSDITLKKDGSMSVTETIVYDFGTEQRHGIFRYIPKNHQQEATSWYKDRYLEIAVDSIKMDGSVAPYEIEQQNDNVFIRIGDPGVTISSVHTYEISYQVIGGLSYTDAAAELYWNVSGDEWEVPIDRAEALVHAPQNLLLPERACYVGALGSTERCQSEPSDNDTIRFTAANLAPGEGMTIAQSLDSHAVSYVVLERIVWVIPWIILAIVWFIGLGIFLYRYAVTHKTHASIIPHYEPYQDIKPMYVGLLFDGRLDSRDISAGIIYLAEQGFFKIKKTSKKALFIFEVDDYEITLLRGYHELTSDFQRKLFTLLFNKSDSVKKTVSLKALSKNTAEQKKNYKILQSLKSAAHQDLITRGYFEHTLKNIFTVSIGFSVILIAIVTFSYFFGIHPTILIIPSAIILFLSVIGFALIYRRRTKKGYEALDHLKGFKLFLSVTDKERFSFHNAPEKNPEQFMKYLPYAIAFGVEEKWALVFKDITIQNPSWYDSGSASQFSAVQLTTSLNAFGTMFTHSSGSASASSGGGFSGGGGGGGGGGSW